MSASDSQVRVHEELPVVQAMNLLHAVSCCLFGERCGSCAGSDEAPSVEYEAGADDEGEDEADDKRADGPTIALASRSPLQLSTSQGPHQASAR